MAGRKSPITLDDLARVEVYNVTTLLKTLGKIDPQLRRATVARMKLAAKPMVEEARRLVPDAAPLDNWGDWTTPKGRQIGRYNAKKIRRGIKVSYKGPSRRDRDKELFPLLKLVNTDAGGAIFDIAGKAGGQGKGSEGAARGRAMISKIQRSNGPASRVAWRAAERHLDDVTDGVKDAIKDMEQAIQKRVERGS